MTLECIWVSTAETLTLIVVPAKLYVRKQQLKFTTNNKFEKQLQARTMHFPAKIER